MSASFFTWQHVLGKKEFVFQMNRSSKIIKPHLFFSRFDDALRNSILLNTRGTYELLKIAETLKNLICFMHCSTAYSNALNDVIEEKVK